MDDLGYGSMGVERGTLSILYGLQNHIPRSSAPSTRIPPSPFRLPKLRPRTGLPHQKRLALNPPPAIRSHVNDHLVHRLPSVPQIQRQTRGRGFDVRFGSGLVCGFEAGADEHSAETEAVVGGVHGEDVEDWGGGLEGGEGVWGCVMGRRPGVEKEERGVV